MNRRERLERKLEKREDWAAGASKKSDEAYRQAGAMASVIPFGQPIHIGHHSERADRNFRAKIGRKMDKSVELMHKAEYHEQKAAGLARQLDNSIFSDDDDALEALMEKVETLEAKAERMKAINKAWKKAKGADGWTDGLDLTEGEARAIAQTFQAWGGGLPFPAYALTNIRARINTAKKRIEDVKVRQARQARAEESTGGVTIEGGDYVCVTFAEKPAREVLNDLKGAGFRWCQGSWRGERARLPEGLTNETERQTLHD